MAAKNRAANSSLYFFSFASGTILYVGIKLGGDTMINLFLGIIGGVAMLVVTMRLIKILFAMLNKSFDKLEETMEKKGL